MWVGSIVGDGMSEPLLAIARGWHASESQELLPEGKGPSSHVRVVELATRREPSSMNRKTPGGFMGHLHEGSPLGNHSPFRRAVFLR